MVIIFFRSMDDQALTFLQDDEVHSYDELEEQLQENELHNCKKVKCSTHLLLACFGSHDITSVPCMKFGCMIEKDLSFSIFKKELPIPSQAVSHITEGGIIRRVSDVQNILAFLKNYEDTGKQTEMESFLFLMENCIEDWQMAEKLKQKWLFNLEQLRLSISKKKKYSQSTLSMALNWLLTSPCLYRQILNEEMLSLPSSGYLKRLSRAFSVTTGFDQTALKYVEERTRNLNELEKKMVCIIDEIHTIQRVEYQGGKVFGLLDGHVTKTLLGIMLKSVAGKFKDMVALFPVDTLNSKLLKKIHDQVLPDLENLGLDVVCMSADNFSANRKFFTQELCNGNLKPFICKSNASTDDVAQEVTKESNTEQKNTQESESILHESDAAERKMFLCFDAVHNFKNLFNNFSKKSSFQCPEFKGEEIGSPSFQHLEELYNIESGNPVKMAHKLTEKVLHPSSIERVNVSLADSAFHESTIAGLEFYGKNGHPEFLNTVPFLKLIRRWWNVCNVKTPMLGIKKRDPSRQPITKVDDEKIQFLLDFAKWLGEWQESKTNGLSKETFIAVKQTSVALALLAKYLLEHCKFKYVLLGQVQSDELEQHFGKYRQLLGGNFFVSVRQVLEAEKIIRMKSLIRYSNLSVGEIKTLLADDKEVDEHVIQQILDCLGEYEMNLDENNLAEQNILFYIAGYIARSLRKNMACEECGNQLIASMKTPKIQMEVNEELTNQQREARDDFLNQINRGGLCTPSDLTFIACIFAENLFDAIMQNVTAKDLLLTSKSPILVFSKVTVQFAQMSHGGRGFSNQQCNVGHEFLEVFHQISRRLFNIMMKNFVAEVNSNTRKLKGQKREGGIKSDKGRKVLKLQSTL